MLTQKNAINAIRLTTSTAISSLQDKKKLIMQNWRRHEFKKQVVKHYSVKSRINSKQKRDCILHLLESPSVEEILVVQQYVNILKYHRQQLTKQQMETQFDTKKSNLCEEKENVPMTSKSTKNKGSSSEDFKSKIPGKGKKPYKNQKKSQVKTLTRSTHSIFDNNLLRPNGAKLGCECTALSGCNYVNPFFDDLFEKITHKIFTIKNAVVENNTVSRGHVITFRPMEEFHHVVTRMKPTLYVSEYVTGTHAAIGMTYSLFIRLAKGNTCVGEYILKHTFTRAQKKFLEIYICNYQDFDSICYYHVANIAPGEPKLNLEKVMSIQIGRSVVMFLSKTIQWTEPGGPKVIVQKVDEVPEHSFY